MVVGYFGLLYHVVLTTGIMDLNCLSLQAGI